MSKNEQQLKSALKRAMPKEKPAGPPAGPGNLINGSGRVPKLSVSLRTRDLQRLDELRAYMQTRGVRKLSDTEALRLAVRGIQFGENLDGVYRELLSEDGRRKAN